MDRKTEYFQDFIVYLWIPCNLNKNSRDLTCGFWQTYPEGYMERKKQQTK